MTRILRIVLIALILLAGCSSAYNRGTYDLYLIPENYEGIIRVTYNVKDAPPLEREGEYDVIPVDSSGTARTSNPMYDSGEVIDHYFYVDVRGNRTRIDPSCVNVRGTGGTQSANEETHFTEIEVTHTSCGNNFRLHGSGR